MLIVQVLTAEECMLHIFCVSCTGINYDILSVSNCTGINCRRVHVTYFLCQFYRY